MPRICSFPPIANSKARILILGSMPGEASLAAQQYYAHPRNQFWPIMCRFLGAEIDLPYAKKTRLLSAHHIALWDVLGACERAGSLDSAIRREQANDFKGFFSQHRSIKRVCFNGKKAEASFRRHVMPLILNDKIEFITLPSTSPANASWSFARKYAAWQKALDSRS